MGEDGGGGFLCVVQCSAFTCLIGPVLIFAIIYSVECPSMISASTLDWVFMGIAMFLNIVGSCAGMCCGTRGGAVVLCISMIFDLVSLILASITFSSYNSPDFICLDD